MTSLVFYRKWRPQTLSQVAGQEQVTRTLFNALTSGRLSHAYLFCGPRGTGKTSTGRILAKAVNCLNNGKGEPCNNCAMCQAITEGRALDVIEIDAASNRKIDDIRELRERVNYLPSQARYKVYIIDEVHMLTPEAESALLKTLEEPPPHVIFILATTEAHKLLPTILSRCQRFDFHRISQKDMVLKLTEVCQGESINMEPEGLQLIARSAQGSLRDAENILEQLVTYYGRDVKRGQVQLTLGISEDERTRELLKHIVNGDVAQGMLTLNSVSGDGLDIKQFTRELISYLRGLLLVKTGVREALDFSPEDLTLLKDLAEKATLTRILRMVKLFGQIEPGSDSYSTLPLELALVDSVLTDEAGERPVAQNESVKAEPEGSYATGVDRPGIETSKVFPDVRKPRFVSKPVSGMPRTQTEASKILPEATKTRSETIKVPEQSMPVPFTRAPSKPTPAPVQGAQLVSVEPTSELEKLRVSWRQVIAQAPADVARTPAIAILRSAGASPVAIEGDTVVLAFRYPLHKEKMSEPENQKIAEKVISSFLGRPVHISCTYQAEDNHLVVEAQRLGAQITRVEEK